MSAIVLFSNFRYKVVQSRCNVLQWRDNRTNNPFSQAQDIDWQIIDGSRFQFSIQFPKVTLIWTLEITLCKGNFYQKVRVSEGSNAVTERVQLRCKSRDYSRERMSPKLKCTYIKFQERVSSLKNSPYIKINWEDFGKCFLGFSRNNVVFDNIFCGTIAQQNITLSGAGTLH